MDKQKYICMDCGKETETYTLIGRHLKQEAGLCFLCYNIRKEEDRPKPLIIK